MYLSLDIAMELPSNKIGILRVLRGSGQENRLREMNKNMPPRAAVVFIMDKITILYYTGV